MGTQIFKALIS